VNLFRDDSQFEAWLEIYHGFQAGLWLKMAKKGSGVEAVSSVCSQVNVAKVEELLAAGRMRAPGIAEVQDAQADGRWAAAYASQRNAVVGICRF